MTIFARLALALRFIFSTARTLSPNVPQKDDLLTLLERQHAQTLGIVQAISVTAGKQADAAKAQAENFTAYLELFKVQTPPEHRALTDADEYEEELKKSGFPVDASPQEQAAWVLRMSE